MHTQPQQKLRGATDASNSKKKSKFCTFNFCHNSGTQEIQHQPSLTPRNILWWATMIKNRTSGVSGGVVVGKSECWSKPSKSQVSDTQIMQKIICRHYAKYCNNIWQLYRLITCWNEIVFSMCNSCSQCQVNQSLLS